MAEKGKNMEKSKTETREERFKRVATRRTNDIMNRIRILGNCSNKSSYSYTEEDIQKIFSVIEKELRVTKVRFVTNRGNKFYL